MKPALMMGFAAVVMAGLVCGCAAKSDVGVDDAPAQVVASFHQMYPGAVIEKIEKEVYDDGTVHYEFEFKGKDGKKGEVELNKEGKLAH